MKKKKSLLDHLRWFTAIALLSLVALNTIGCSSISIAKQKKVAELIGKQIEFIGDQVIARCNDGTLKQKDCDNISDCINLALDGQNAYTRSLIAMQNGAGSQEQVQKTLEALQGDMANLVSEAISLGIKIRKDL